MACESKKQLLDIDAYVEDYDTKWAEYCIRPDMYVFFVQALNDMWVHSPPLGAQANFNRIEKRDTM